MAPGNSPLWTLSSTINPMTNGLMLNYYIDRNKIRIQHAAIYRFALFRPMTLMRTFCKTITIYMININNLCGIKSSRTGKKVTICKTHRLQTDRYVKLTDYRQTLLTNFSISVQTYDTKNYASIWTYTLNHLSNHLSTCDLTHWPLGDLWVIPKV